jgi:hypothetical protein
MGTQHHEAWAYMSRPSFEKRFASDHRWKPRRLFTASALLKSLTDASKVVMFL